ncbi:MAG: PAS domain S-box protein [Gammaproteobacteria bacterium]|nr:MAG: PAS domain S-box protein [Gammaproteobacteria bacterium]
MSRELSAEEIRISAVASAVFALVLVVGIGAALINAYVTRERQRDLQQWESRIGLVADSKAGAIEQLLREDLAELGELAGNASVPMYLEQALHAAPDAAPQLAYLRNLLLATALRLGLEPSPAARLPANVNRPAGPGLGLLGPDTQPVIATPGVVLERPALLAAARRVLADGQAEIAGPYRESDGEVLFAYLLPISPLPGSQAGDARRPPGVLVAVRDAAGSLFRLLAEGAAFAEPHEILLLRRAGDHVLYLSPTHDGSGALRRSLPLDRPRLAAAAAVLEPGAFGQYDNYAGKPVLQVSRQLAGRDWVVAVQVDARQALRAANARRNFLLTTLSLLLVSVVALYIAAWRHGASLRARHQAAEFAEQARKLRRQTELLHTITDNVGSLILLVDRDWKVVFTNRAVAEATGGTVTEIIGKPLAAALGAAVARELRQAVETTPAPGDPPVVLSLQFGDKAGRYRLTRLPVEELGDLRQLLLIVLDDISELELAEARYARLLENLVDTLAAVIDLHDSYSAFHSARMKELVRELGRELGLSEQDQRTLEFSATLANIGKLMLPRELLTKTGDLSEEEKKQLETHVARGLELLHNLDFDGPLLTTIAQKQELLDGSGYPRGLTADEMTLPGKILAVANAFVALVSPRAYRDALPVKAALDQLLAETGSKYDRQVVAALLHVAENRIDWSRWSRRGEAS